MRKMAVSRGAVLFLLLLLVAAEMGAMVDANMGVAKETLLKDEVKEEEEDKSKEKQERICLSKSVQFNGFCFDSDKCDEVCKKESFGGGECKLDTIKRKCFCKKPC